jgi:GH18 family chitinase
MLQASLLLVLTALTVGGLHDLPAEEKTSPAIAVYFPDYRYREGIEPKFYGSTHLVLFSSKPNEDGSVDFDRITPGLLEIGRKAKLKNIKVTCCVGGWGRGKLFATAVSSAENRTRFVAALGDFCEQHQLDGVDIDWEFPKGDKEHADFALFLQELSLRLHTDKRLLTIALGYTRPLSRECYDCVDQVNLMCYQPWNPPKESHAAWLGDAVDQFLASGVPPEKLLLGVGFFAKELGGERRAISYQKLVGENAQPLPESEHGFSPVGKDACDLRIDLVKKHSLGGVMVWDYGHDSTDPQSSLLNYLTKKFTAPPRPPSEANPR